MRRKLELKDETIVSTFCSEAGFDSFYHYFPLMFAISESGANLEIDPDFNIWADKDELYVGGDALFEDELVRKLWVSQTKAPMGWRTELYDVNFVYDLDVTLKIKNFRKNVNKFIRANSELIYVKPLQFATPLHVVEDWYRKSHREKVTDFGYTMWLTENYDKFESLHPRIVCIGAKAVAFSLWGELSEGLGIHLICKDLGYAYLQDYTRFMTYSEMLEKGFKLVNDGGDCNEYGIRVYKLKLRPKFIIPIWSWIRG